MATRERFDDIELDNRTTMLIFGYIRRIQQSLSIDIALELYKICCMFYLLDPLKIAQDIKDKWDSWDPDTIGKLSSIYTENKYKLIGDHIHYGGYYSFGKKEVSSGVAIWRLEAT